MACCVLAAFLIGHILIFWDRVRSWFGITPNRPSAADWRPGQVSPAAPQASRHRHWGWFLVVSGALGMAGVAYAAASPTTVELGNSGIFVPLCEGETAFWTKLLSL